MYSWNNILNVHFIGINTSTGFIVILLDTEVQRRLQTCLFSQNQHGKRKYRTLLYAYLAQTK